MRLPRAIGPRNDKMVAGSRPETLVEAAEFKAEMDRMLVALRNQPALDESKSISYAGLPEHEAFPERSKTGVPLPEHTVAYFKQMAAEQGVEYTLPG